MYSTGHKRLDKSDIISTYPTLKRRIRKPFEDELTWWLHGRLSLLLLSATWRGKEAGVKSGSYRHRSVLKFVRSKSFFEMILYSNYMMFKFSTTFERERVLWEIRGKQINLRAETFSKRIKLTSDFNNGRLCTKPVLNPF